jgi:uncharacterized repeat protein (TIGR03803 family)
MKTRLKQVFLLSVLTVGLGWIPAGRLAAQTYTNFYNFSVESLDASIEADTNSDGANPEAGLISSDNILFGTASEGGTNGNGSVFALTTNGTVILNLHSFSALSGPRPGTNSDGANPEAGLFLSGNILYGTANAGGVNGSGTVFSVTTYGTGFTNLHSFTALPVTYRGGNIDGANPQAGLVLSGNTLYGTANSGGTNGYGTVFSINTDGTGFTNLHSFTGMSDGATPQAGLVLSGNTLYGTANGGGSNGNGVVFALNTDGTGFTNLYGFSATGRYPGPPTNIDGANPSAGLLLSGDTLYGTTYYGGTNNDGVVFSVTTNGTGFMNLHNFTGFNDGANLYGGLILLGNTLYGTADNGGNTYGGTQFPDGTLFSVTTNGADFTSLYTFTNEADGISPRDTLVLAGNTLYGTAGGGANGSGVVFSLLLPPPTPAVILSERYVVLTWPTNSVFTLQSTTNLDAAWTTNVPAPVVVNGMNTVSNPVSGTQQFFRLSQ